MSILLECTTRGYMWATTCTATAKKTLENLKLTWHCFTSRVLQLTKIKDHTHLDMRSGMVFHLSSSACENHCTGDTGRQLGVHNENTRQAPPQLFMNVVRLLIKMKSEWKMSKY